jgi:hypothetical protein
MSFDDRSINVNDEIIHDNVPLISTSERQYRRIGTTIFIIIHILSLVKKENSYIHFKKNLLFRLYLKRSLYYFHFYVMMKIYQNSVVIILHIIFHYIYMLVVI